MKAVFFSSPENFTFFKQKVLVAYAKNAFLRGKYVYDLATVLLRKFKQITGLITEVIASFLNVELL